MANRPSPSHKVIYVFWRARVPDADLGESSKDYISLPIVAPKNSGEFGLTVRERTMLYRLHAIYLRCYRFVVCDNEMKNKILSVIVAPLISMQCFATEVGKTYWWTPINQGGALTIDSAIG